MVSGNYTVQYDNMEEFFYTVLDGVSFFFLLIGKFLEVYKVKKMFQQTNLFCS